MAWDLHDQGEIQKFLNLLLGETEHQGFSQELHSFSFEKYDVGEQLPIRRHSLLDHYPLGVWPSSFAAQALLELPAHSPRNFILSSSESDRRNILACVA